MAMNDDNPFEDKVESKEKKAEKGYYQWHANLTKGMKEKINDGSAVFLGNRKAVHTPYNLETGKPFTGAAGVYLAQIAKDRGLENAAFVMASHCFNREDESGVCYTDIPMRKGTKQVVIPFKRKSSEIVPVKLVAAADIDGSAVKEMLEKTKPSAIDEKNFQKMLDGMKNVKAVDLSESLFSFSQIANDAYGQYDSNGNVIREPKAFKMTKSVKERHAAEKEGFERLNEIMNHVLPEIPTVGDKYCEVWKVMKERHPEESMFKISTFAATSMAKNGYALQDIVQAVNDFDPKVPEKNLENSLRDDKADRVSYAEYVVNSGVESLKRMSVARAAH